MKNIKKTPLSHPYVVFPALIDELKGVNGKRMLDLGCGSGDFSKMLVDMGKIADGIDLSEKWIERARADYNGMENLNFFVGDSSNLSQIENEAYDAVIMNMVFINISKKDVVEKTFKEVYRVLKKGGSLLFTDLHPLCKMIPDTLTEHQEYLENFSYFRDGSKFTSRVQLADNSSSIDFVDAHWTLETYSKFINDSKMFIYRIIEPSPIDGSPEIYDGYKLPEYILFHCKK